MKIDPLLGHSIHPVTFALQGLTRCNLRGKTSYNYKSIIKTIEEAKSRKCMTSSLQNSAKQVSIRLSRV
jgi:hypothetical protein